MTCHAWLLLLSVSLVSGCFDPHLSGKPMPTQAFPMPAQPSKEAEGSSAVEADAGDRPPVSDASTQPNEALDGGLDALTAVRHAQCASSRPDPLPTLTGARPWFPLMPMLSCEEISPLMPCGPRDSCPFDGRCLHVDGSDPGVCVKGEGSLALVYREGTCVTWVDEATRASLCCAGFSGLDCETTPRASRGAPGALCGRHEDCEEGLVCKTSKAQGRCLCPETELREVANSSTCERPAGPRRWGVAPKYDPGHSCLSAPQHDLSIDVLFDRYVEDDSLSASDALIDAEVLGDTLHIAYAAPDGVIMHLVAKNGEVEPVAMKRVLQRVGDVAVPVVFHEIDLAIDALAPEGPLVHMAIAADTGLLYLTGNELSKAAPFATDLAFGFDDTVPNDHGWPRTPLIALASGRGVELYALSKARFERVSRWPSDSTGQGSTQLALSTGSSGALEVLVSEMYQDTPDNAWYGKRVQGGLQSHKLGSCRAPVTAGGWFACDDTKGATLLFRGQNYANVSTILVRNSEAWALENTLPALAESASQGTHVAYRTPEGLETRVLGSAAAPRLVTPDRTTSRAVVLPSSGDGVAGVMYATTTTSRHHHQLRFAHPGPCLRPDHTISTAPEPAKITPVTHPGCTSALNFEPLALIVDRDGSGRPLASGMSDANCAALPPPRVCSESEPCFAGEACLEVATPGRRVCIEASLSDERCSMPIRDDRARQGVLGLTEGGQCLHCFSPESKRAACCAGVVGLDCREFPYALLGTIGEMCTAHDECEPGLVCAGTSPGFACVCPETNNAPISAANPNDKLSLCEPARQAWLDGGLPELAVGECVRSLAPGWSIENVAPQLNFWFDSLKGRVVADATGGLAAITPAPGGLFLVRLSDGVWTRELVDEAGHSDASIAIDEHGTLYVIAYFVGDTQVLSNESGTFARWPVKLQSPISFGAALANSAGVIELVGNYDGWNYNYLRLDRSGLLSAPISSGEEFARLVRAPSGETHLYSSTQGGPIRNENWFATTVPTLADVAPGRDGIVRVEESPPHGLRVVTVDGSVEEVWQNTDPHYAAGATKPSLAVGSDGAFWISHSSPQGLMVSTNAGGTWQSTPLVRAQLVHEIVMDAQGEPHVLFSTSEYANNNARLYHAFRGACAK